MDGSDEEGEVKESSSAQPESFGKAERERNEVLRQVEKLKLRKGRKRPRTDQEKLAQHKADLLLLSDSSPEWQRKVEAYLAERPDLRTKGVHANLPQPSTSQPKVGSVKEAGSNKSAHNDHSSSRTNGSDLPVIDRLENLLTSFQPDPRSLNARHPQSR